MNFEWDQEKGRFNLSKHDVTFEEAITVFDDPLALTFEDMLHSIQEDRFLTIGYSNLARLLTVVATERGNKIRIISARTVTKRGRNIYEERI